MKVLFSDKNKIFTLYQFLTKYVNSDLYQWPWYHVILLKFNIFFGQKLIKEIKYNNKIEVKGLIYNNFLIKKLKQS